eukprot:1139407-Pelagomonas_calceolata.AAC.3
MARGGSYLVPPGPMLLKLGVAWSVSPGASQLALWLTGKDQLATPHNTLVIPLPGTSWPYAAHAGAPWGRRLPWHSPIEALCKVQAATALPPGHAASVPAGRHPLRVQEWARAHCVSAEDPTRTRRHVGGNSRGTNQVFFGTTGHVLAVQCPYAEAQVASDEKHTRGLMCLAECVCVCVCVCARRSPHPNRAKHPHPQSASTAGQQTRAATQT